MKKTICTKLLVCIALNVLILPLVHAGKRSYYRQKNNHRHFKHDKQNLKNKKLAYINTKKNKKARKIKYKKTRKKDKASLALCKLLQKNGWLTHAAALVLLPGAFAGSIVIDTPIGPVRIKFPGLPVRPTGRKTKKIESCIPKEGIIRPLGGYFFYKDCDIREVDVDTKLLVKRYRTKYDPDFCHPNTSPLALNCRNGTRVCYIKNCAQCYKENGWTFGYHTNDKVKTWAGEGINSGVCLNYGKPIASDLGPSCAANQTTSINCSLQEQTVTLQFWTILLIGVALGISVATLLKVLALPIYALCWRKFFQKKHPDVYLIENLSLGQLSSKERKKKKMRNTLHKNNSYKKRKKRKKRKITFEISQDSDDLSDESTNTSSFLSDLSSLDSSLESNTNDI